MTRDRLVRALSARPVQTDRSDVAISHVLGDAPHHPPPAQEPRALVPAAVLVPLIQRNEGLSVLLTERTAHLANHAGQVSFPGGRMEEGDADPVATALRETEEEICLSPRCVDVLGQLDDYVTVTGVQVVPVVGLIHPPFTLNPDPFEVAEVFEVPLDFILDPANHQRHSRIAPQGEPRYFYAMPFNDHYIWGATAAMLVNLYEILGRPCGS